MSLFDNVLTRMGLAPASKLAHLQAELEQVKAASKPAPAELLAMASGLKWDIPQDGYADEKYGRLYQNLTWISTAIDRTAEIAAAAIYSVRRVSGEPGGPDDEDLPNHDYERLLRRPNPSQSRGEFLRDCFTMFRVTGNLYLHLNRPGELVPPVEQWIIPSHMMKPIPDGRMYIRGYWFTPPGHAPEFVEPWKIFHMKTSNPLNPFIGLSAIQSLMLDSMGDLAQQRWNANLFSQNNGKLPIILGFKERFTPLEWEEMKRQRDEEWGGTNRPGVMLLQGVGDAMTLLEAGTTQKEMEFLAGRAFTKEEIYGKLAPGLASILAVNATEANAIAGKATLIEYGVWPTLVQLAEKITSDILPLYGDGELVGEFDDMRQTNRILDLQEQAEFAKYHTVNEVRAEYYDEGPLELDPSVIEQIEADEQEEQERVESMPVAPTVPAKADKPMSKLDPRGFLFPAQIGPTTPAPGEPRQPPPQFGQPGQPPIAQPEGDAVPDQESADDGQAAEQELKTWERLAIKHLGTGGYTFVPKVLSWAKAGRIQAALKGAPTEPDVRAVFARERGEQGEMGRLADAIEKAAAKL